MSTWFFLVFSIPAIAVLCKLYLKLTIMRTDSYTCLVGKTAIVTGANTGIGYETALEFACRGARVILACRNKEKAEEAQRKIIKATGNQNVVYKHIDLSSFQSVRDFAKDINENEQRLDILVNNAGVACLGNTQTTDGVLITMQINHFSGFLLTHLLIDKMIKSAPSTIVNVSSSAACVYKLNFDNLNSYPTDIISMLAEWRLYSISKLCNVYFTTELAKKLKGTNVTVNAVNPGPVVTDIFRYIPNWFKYTGMIIIKLLYFKTAEEGARTVIYAATSPSVKYVSGQFLDNCQVVDLYNSAKDVDLGRKLWIKSEEVVKLREDEKIK